MRELANDCRLCKVHDSSTNRESWNEFIFETKNFAVLPSLGALVPGWLLIMPKGHFLSASVVPAHLQYELLQIVDDVVEVLHREYGPTYVFEHGPAREGRLVGCGVDHAHIHAVPFAQNLRRQVEESLPGSATFSPGNLVEAKRATEKGEDYLLLREPSGHAFVATHQSFESQTFRRAIAASLGIPEEYDWRAYPNVQNVNATLEKLRGVPETLRFNEGVKSAGIA